GNVGRSLIHNGTFQVQQRGAGSWNLNSNYTADRWQLLLINDTDTATIQTLADADRTAIGDEAAIYALQHVFVGSATAGSVSSVTQKIENVRRLGGKQIIVSFWARATSGSPRIGVILSQSFGSGGSPSATINNTLGATAALPATW